ncbi:MAG: hypothetical protein ACT4PV_02215 [Planctomycetaceae bacterium]
MKPAGAATLFLEAGPRPDPLPVVGGPGLAIHAPWLVSAGLATAALLLLSTHAAGIAACAGGAVAVAVAAARRRPRAALRAAHATAAVATLALASGFQEAGAYLPVAAAIAVVGLAARACALVLHPAVAPLAGLAPWRFVRSYRRHLALFGAAGLLGAAGAAALLPPSLPAVAAVALLPVTARAYVSCLLPRRARNASAATALLAQITLLAILVPRYGSGGAAGAMVAAETIGFALAAWRVAHGTGATPFTLAGAAVALGGTLLLASVALPAPLLIGLPACALLAGLFLGAHARAQR